MSDIYGTVEYLLWKVETELGPDFSVALFTNGYGSRGGDKIRSSYAMIMRRPFEKYPVMWSKGRGETVHQALNEAVEQGIIRLKQEREKEYHE